MLASLTDPVLPGALTTLFCLSWVHSMPVLLFSLCSLKTLCCLPTTGPLYLLSRLYWNVLLLLFEAGSLSFNLKFKWSLFRETPSIPQLFYIIFPSSPS